MSSIHPTASIDAQAELDADVEVGAFSYIGAGVRVGAGCTLAPHVTLLGPAEFGPQNVFYSGSVLGAAPQDVKYRGGPTRLNVGAGNTFREHVTVHRGTEVDRISEGVTRIGNRSLFMVGVHVGHDAHIGDHAIVANASQLGGHVRLEDCVVIGGASALQPFVTVGRNAYIGGMTRVTHDVPPYMKVMGYDQAVRGTNVEGLRRWAFPAASISSLRTAGRMLYARRRGVAAQTGAVLTMIEANGLMQDEHVRYLVRFLRQKLAIGVFGRVREHARTDCAADSEHFYRRGTPRALEDAGE